MGKKSGKNAGKSNPTGSEPVKEKKSKQQKHKPSDSAGAAAMGVKTPEDAAAKLHAPAKPAATETASPASVDAREGLMRSYADSLRDFFGDQIEGIKSEMDPEKLSAFTREAKTIIRGGLYSGIGIVAVVMIMLVIELHSEGRIFPGVKVGTTEVGYLQKDEAKEKIVAELQGYMKTPLFFSYEGNTIEVPAQELGIRLNIDQTLEKVPTFNIQEEGLLQLLVSTYAAPGVGIDYSFDGDAVIGSLEQKFHLSDVRAKNARFVWADDELGIEPEKNGIAINRDKLMADLRNRIENVSTSPVSVEALEETPRVTAAELEKERENLVALLKMPLNLSYGDDGLTLKLIDHLDAVSFREKNALKFNNTRWALPVVITDGQVAMAKSDEVELTSRIQIEVDGGKLEPVLAENLLKDIEVPTSPANIYKDDNGKVVIDGKGEDGRSVSRPQLVEAIELAANFGISDVPVPVYVEHAPLTISDDLKELGITELIATGHSSYYGSPANRMFNISHGIKKFNGALIAPDAEFSFNDVLGPVEAGSGFKMEKVIKKDKAEYELGGGICQVSTTMYRALLQAGLPITERKPHSWKVSYYGQSMGHGLDATIYPGVTDLKFLNDTGNYLLVQAYDEGAEAYFKIYGTSDGRIAKLDGPYGGGLTWRWNRILIKDGVETTEEIWSQYRPIPAPEPPKPIAQKPADGVPQNF